MATSTTCAYVATVSLFGPGGRWQLRQRGQVPSSRPQRQGDTSSLRQPSPAAQRQSEGRPMWNPPKPPVFAGVVGSARGIPSPPTVVGGARESSGISGNWLWRRTTPAVGRLCNIIQPCSTGYIARPPTLCYTRPQQYGGFNKEAQRMINRLVKEMGGTERGKPVYEYTGLVAPGAVDELFMANDPVVSGDSSGQLFSGTRNGRCLRINQRG